MEHSKKLLSPAEALYKALRPSVHLPPRRLLSQGRTFTPFANSRPPPPEPASRSSSDPRQAQQLIPGLDKKLSGYTINDAISTFYVQVRKPDGKLDEPTVLPSLLSQLNPNTHVVRQLSPTGPNKDCAIVEIQAIEELLQHAAEKATAAKEVEKARREQKLKQLEVNWAISENDLGLKLKQLEQFLAKGRKVEVLLAARKGQRKASQEEAQALIKKLQEKVEETDAKQIKMEGKILGQAMLTFQKKKA